VRTSVLQWSRAIRSSVRVGFDGLRTRRCWQSRAAVSQSRRWLEHTAPGVAASILEGVTTCRQSTASACRSSSGDRSPAQTVHCKAMAARMALRLNGQRHAGGDQRIRSSVHKQLAALKATLIAHDAQGVVTQRLQRVPTTHSIIPARTHSPTSTNVGQTPCQNEWL
jgi:hypothetical protein